MRAIHDVKIASLLAFTLVASACGDSPTEARATASAVAYDNPSSTSSASSGGSGSGTYGGTLSGMAEVAISTNGQTWVSLGAPASFNLQLQSTGNGAILKTTVSIPVGSYAHVRLTLSGASASVSGIVGGTTYGNAHVAIGGGTVVIEKQVQPITVTESSVVRVLFDVNSELFITSQAVQSGTAAAAAVQAAVYATIEAS